MPSKGAVRYVTSNRGLPAIALALSTAIWIGLFASALGGAGSDLYSASMSPGSTVASTFEFLCGWEVMAIAMMLPSSLSFLMLFRTVTAGDRHPGGRRTAVCLGYAFVWAAVGCLALIVTDTVYRISALDLWLNRHASLFAGVVLILAGSFQFTTLKRRCLAVCSRPGGFLARHYRRGVGSAVDLGVRYGIACVGCCWALMLVMVLLGAGSLYAMIVLTAIMFAERALGWNHRFAGTIGLACIGLGALVAATPEAVPALAHNAGMWTGMGLMAPSHLSWCHA
jgi:predicted metal-binding membrane protein